MMGPRFSSVKFYPICVFSGVCITIRRIYIEPNYTISWNLICDPISALSADCTAVYFDNRGYLTPPIICS